MEEEKQEIVTIEPVVEIKPVHKTAKILAIVAFSVTMLALVAAIIVDIFVFLEAIITFIAGIIVSAFVFILCLLLMVVSCILIFGVYILESQGFWPLTLAADVLHQAVADAKPSAQQLAIFSTTRIILLVVCFITFILAIVVLALVKTPKGEKKNKQVKVAKGFAIPTLIFAILGVLVQAGMLFILSLI